MTRWRRHESLSRLSTVYAPVGGGVCVVVVVVVCSGGGGAGLVLPAQAARAVVATAVVRSTRIGSFIVVGLDRLSKGGEALWPGASRLYCPRCRYGDQA